MPPTPRRSRTRPSKLGLNLKFYDAQNKLENQRPAFRQFIADDEVDVIVLAALEAAGWDDVLKEAKAKGKTVVLEDRRIDAAEDLYATYIGSDFTEEGRKAADRDVQAARRTATRRTSSSSSATSARRRRSTAARASARRWATAGSRSPRARPPTGTPTRARPSPRPSSRRARTSRASSPRTTRWASAPSRRSQEAGLKPAEDVKIITVDATKGAFQAMIDGTINTVVECNPLLATAGLRGGAQGRQRRDPPQVGPVASRASSTRRTPRRSCRPASTERLRPSCRPRGGRGAQPIEGRPPGRPSTVHPGPTSDTQVGRDRRGRAPGDAGHRQGLSRASRRSHGVDFDASRPARSTRSSARTAPASRP